MRRDQALHLLLPRPQRDPSFQDSVKRIYVPPYMKMDLQGGMSYNAFIAMNFSLLVMSLRTVPNGELSHFVHKSGVILNTNYHETISSVIKSLGACSISSSVSPFMSLEWRHHMAPHVPPSNQATASKCRCLRCFSVHPSLNCASFNDIMAICITFGTHGASNSSKTTSLNVRSGTRSSEVLRLFTRWTRSTPSRYMHCGMLTFP